MSESALPFHRKYRPTTIKEYVGNTKIKKGVMSALRTEHKPQVILMTGHAGTGKTTMARLLAKEYMCEDRDDLAGACGKCQNCEMVSEFIETGESGSLMNVREVDVTGSGGKGDIEALLDEASIPTFEGSWKVYILDECHAMTIAAQNRLLKTLEEPAEKVLMVLCTTDPQKLLETIISRCQYRFEVTKPTREELGGLLQKVCQAEGVEFEPKGLSLVCVKGDFVPRKSLVSLEQVVRQKGSVTYDNAVEVLNVIADEYFFEFYRILLSDSIDILKYVTFLGNLRGKMDLKQFVDGLTSFTKRGIFIVNGVSVDALDKSEIALYRKTLAKLSVGETVNLLTVLLDMKNSMDIETKLLLLGYKGLKRKENVVGVEKPDSDLLESTSGDVAKERSTGDTNFITAITMSDDEKEVFVESHNKPVDADALSKLFGSTTIDLSANK